MRIMRLIFRIIRLVSVIYTLWRAYQKGKRFILITGLWRLLRRKPVLGIKKPELVFVDSTDPRIYRRRGWRKYSSRVNKKE